MVFPLIFLDFSVLNFVKSSDLNITFPCVILEMFFGSKFIIAKDDTDFPDPDSPTIPIISFSNSSNDMFLKISFSIVFEKKETFKFSTESNLILGIGKNNNFIRHILSLIIYHIKLRE